MEKKKKCSDKVRSYIGLETDAITGLQDAEYVLLEIISLVGYAVRIIRSLEDNLVTVKEEVSKDYLTKEEREKLTMEDIFGDTNNKKSHEKQSN